MKTISILSAAVLVVLLAVPASAQNREHQQMAAELRMLQEQNQQLSLALQQLAEALKAVNARIDESNQATKTGFANQQLGLNNMANDVGAIRERTQDADNRFRTLSDEISALQTTINSLAVQLVQGAGLAPGGSGAVGAVTPGAPGDPTATAGTTPAPTVPPTPAPGVTAPSTIGLSPTRMLEEAKSDYYRGQYTLAITGFERLVSTFSSTAAAAEAQFWIGESYYSLKRWPDAVTAYNTLIQSAPRSTFAADAYYKRGLALEGQGQVDAARASWQEVIKQFPDSTGAQLARQNLERVNRAQPAARP